MKFFSPAILAGILLFFGTSAEGVEVSARNVKIYLTETLTNTDEASERGISETIPAPEGKKFLCVTFDFVGKNWGEDRALRLDKSEIVLKADGEVIANAGEHQTVPGSFFLNPQPIYLPKGNSEGGESYKPVGPIFVVPAAFSEGTVHFGNYLEVPVAAKDSSALGSAADLANFTVSNARFVEELESNERVGTENVKSIIKPSNGKILVVDLEIDSKAAFSFQTTDLAISFGGMSRSSAGVIQRAGSAMVGSSGFSPIAGTQLKSSVFFVVPSEEGKLSLLFRGEEIAKIPIRS